MSSNDVAVSIRGLSKAYVIAHQNVKRATFGDVVMERIRNPFRKTQHETFWALRDVSFDVRQGEVVGIIGRNGAGKSTLLKILSRITEPSDGRVELFGRVGSLLEVGTGFHPELTGRENIYLNGAVLGMTRGEIRRQFDAIVDFAEVEKFLDTPVKRYSSGMYVRLAFAVAAHLNPEILVVDEVLAVGDAEFQRKCMGKMNEVAKGGRTVIFVSHNMAAVESLCDRCVLLREGRKFFHGEVDHGIELYSQSDADAGATIASMVKFCHPNLVIDEIEINGKSSHTIQVPSQVKELEVRIAGTLKASARVDLELWINDVADMPLAFYGYGHRHGFTPVRERGPFEIRRRIALPENLHRGEYHVRIALTDHNVSYYADAPRAARLEVDGVATATGRPLEYRERKGFISLEEIEE